MTVKAIRISSYLQDEAGGFRRAQMNLERDEVVFEYVWNDFTYIYKGRQNAMLPGRYDLRCETAHGTLKLHRLQGSDRILGHWTEGAQHQGLFLIDVDDDDE